MNQHLDSIIIGAGIAGITAAIYLKRANKDVILLEKYIPGGQINNTSLVENYPSYSNIDGPSLVMNLVNQVNYLNIPLLYEEVLEVSKEDNFIVKTNKNTYTADNIVIATGRIPNKLEVTLPFEGKGVSYCALCDGALYKDKDIVVVGSGDSAFEESLYLSKICSKVTIISRSSNIRASKILQDKINETSNVEIICNEEIVKVNGESEITSVTLKNQEIPCSGIFVYIGSTPKLDFLNNLGIDIENNYIVVNEKMQTSIPHIYACGDVIKKDVYQIITASSEGAIAASSIIKDGAYDK